MRYAIAAMMMAAGPALAHTGPQAGAHLHPHGVEGWVVGLGLLVVGAAAAVAVARRR